MITLKDALIILDRTPVKPEIEEVSIEEALNRILAQDIISRINMPPFHKSAMDGYAYDSSDTSIRFEIAETIPAGVIPKKKIEKGQCAKIMTGGMVPAGADRVVKRELAVEEDRVMRITAQEPNFNICYEGEDVKIGDVVLGKGALIRPQEIGIIASMGLARLQVYRRPELGIVATGSELVEPGSTLNLGQIYNSNTYSLAAQIQQTGAVLKAACLTVDSVIEIRSSLDRFLAVCDMVLVSGGVSEGDYDYVPSVLEELGLELKFEKVAIQPGKPTVFSAGKEKVVFGIPGNPVSAFVVFEIFIKPFLFKMMGHTYQPKMIQGVMSNGFKRGKAERTAYIPVRHHNGYVDLLPYHGSAHVHALGQADGLICVPRGENEIPAGAKVDVRQI